LDYEFEVIASAIIVIAHAITRMEQTDPAPFSSDAEAADRRHETGRSHRCSRAAGVPCGRIDERPMR
jgi:hypothetical protein